MGGFGPEEGPEAELWRATRFPEGSGPKRRHLDRDLHPSDRACNPEMVSGCIAFTTGLVSPGVALKFLRALTWDMAESVEARKHGAFGSALHEGSFDAVADKREDVRFAQVQ